EALAEQTDNAELKAVFTPVAQAMAENEAAIVNELNEVQGRSVDMGGYYLPDDEMMNSIMRPSATLNAILSQLV
ncbi:NADP-dependent isocitrate dehydrogenase, partial [Methylophaga sp. UBA5088]